MDDPPPTPPSRTDADADASSGADAAPVPTSARSFLASPLARALECGILFGLVPALVEEFGQGHLVIPLLLAFGLYAFAMLYADPTFDRRRYWNVAGLISHWRRVVLIFVLGAAAIAIFTWLLVPHRLFGFVSHNPRFYAVVMVLYPIFSVYPQELIFRTYFFHRFKKLFPNPYLMIAASALAFGWAHIVIGYWVSVVLATIGGLLFAYTYRHTRSTLAASIEHALYGDFIWTIGLGVFFYAGSLGS